MSLPTDFLLEKLIELFVNRKKKQNEQETIEIVRIFPKYENRIFDKIFEVYREKKLISKWKKAKNRPNKKEKIKTEIGKEVREYGNYIFQITNKYLGAIEHSIKRTKPLDLLNETQEHITSNLEDWLNSSPEIEDDETQPLEMSWYEITNMMETEYRKFNPNGKKAATEEYPTLPDSVYYWVSKKIQRPKTEDDYFGVVFLYCRFVHFRGKRLIIPLEYLQKLPSNSNPLQRESLVSILAQFYKNYEFLGTEHISKENILDIILLLAEDSNPKVQQAAEKVLEEDIKPVHTDYEGEVVIDEDMLAYLFKGKSTRIRLFILKRIMRYEPLISAGFSIKMNATLVGWLQKLAKDKDKKVAEEASKILKDNESRISKTN